MIFWGVFYFLVFYYETYQSAGVPRRCNVGSSLVDFVDRPNSLILDVCHADLCVHDGHSELCCPNFHALLLLNQMTGTEGDLRRGRVEVKAFFRRPYSDPLTYYGTLVRQQIKPLLSSSCHAICSMSFFKVTKQTFYLFLDYLDLRVCHIGSP